MGGRGELESDGAPSGDRSTSFWARVRSHKIIQWRIGFHDMRKLPRFEEFARQIGLVDYWKQYGWPDMCRPFGENDFECD
jgi:hypothetical protein